MKHGWPESMMLFSSLGSMRDIRSDRRNARRCSIRQTRKPTEEQREDRAEEMCGKGKSIRMLFENVAEKAGRPVSR